jgi:hypothetical protein
MPRARIDGDVSVDSTAVRAHQHAAGSRRAPPAGGCSKGGRPGADPGHWRGQSTRMDDLAGYDDVVCEVVVGRRTPDGHRGVRRGRPLPGDCRPRAGLRQDPRERLDCGQTPSGRSWSTMEFDFLLKTHAGPDSIASEERTG